MRQNTHSIIVPMREYNDLKKLEENYHEYCTNIETIYKNILNERINQLKTNGGSDYSIKESNNE